MKKRLGGIAVVISAIAAIILAIVGVLSYCRPNKPEPTSVQNSKSGNQEMQISASGSVSADNNSTSATSFTHTTQTGNAPLNTNTSGSAAVSYGSNSPAIQGNNNSAGNVINNTFSVQPTKDDRQFEMRIMEFFNEVNPEIFAKIKSGEKVVSMCLTDHSIEKLMKFKQEKEFDFYFEISGNGNVIMGDNSNKVGSDINDLFPGSKTGFTLGVKRPIK